MKINWEAINATGTMLIGIATIILSSFVYFQESNREQLNMKIATYDARLEVYKEIKALAYSCQMIAQIYKEADKSIIYEMGNEKFTVYNKIVELFLSDKFDEYINIINTYTYNSKIEEIFLFPDEVQEYIIKARSEAKIFLSKFQEHKLYTLNQEADNKIDFVPVLEKLSFDVFISANRAIFEMKKIMDLSKI